jgi:hypothetical protein
MISDLTRRPAAGIVSHGLQAVPLVTLRAFLSPLAGVLLGGTYGLAARWLTHDRSHGPHAQAIVLTFTGVSIAFLFLVPYALGVLTAALAPRALRQPWLWLYWIHMPCVSVGLMLAAAAALALE